MILKKKALFQADAPTAKDATRSGLCQGKQERRIVNVNQNRAKSATGCIEEASPERVGFSFQTALTAQFRT
jgi:hypothetical protein